MTAEAREANQSSPSYKWYLCTVLPLGARVALSSEALQKVCKTPRRRARVSFFLSFNYFMEALQQQQQQRSIKPPGLAQTQQILHGDKKRGEAAPIAPCTAACPERPPPPPPPPPSRAACFEAGARDSSRLLCGRAARSLFERDEWGGGRAPKGHKGGLWEGGRGDVYCSKSHVSTGAVSHLIGISTLTWATQ